MNGYEKRTLEKKKKVIETTFQLINTDSGIDSLTMDDIAKYSGVGKTSIFKYFESKENLIRLVYTDIINTMIMNARSIMEKNMPFQETIIEMSQYKINFLKTINKRFFLELMKFATEKNDSGLTFIMQKFYEESFSMMLDIFHRGRKEGKVDLKYSDEFLMLYFQAMAEGISSPLIYEKIMPYTSEWTEMLLKSIAPSK